MRIKQLLLVIRYISLKMQSYFLSQYSAVQCCLSYFYPHFTEEETKPLRGSGTCPGHSFRRDSQLSVPDWSDTRECVLYPILVSDAMIISLPCKCSCMRGCPVLFNCSWYAQASFLLLLFLVPSPLISVHLFVTESLFPPVPLPSSPHFYIKSCRWTRVGGPCAEAHGRGNVEKKGSF